MSSFRIITMDELLKTLSNYSHKELHIHHTWQPDHATYYDTKAANDDQRALNRQQAFKDFHVKTNGWSDIAQHVTLLPDGRFVTGRPLYITPASIAGYNIGAFMVEMIGDFDTGKDKLEGAQLQSILGLTKWFDDRGKYTRFHRENAPKSCPGSGIDKAAFMAAARAQSNNLEVEIVLKRGDRGDAVIALQNNLQTLGYSPGTPDGIFGALTEEAVKAFQKVTGLPADGIAGAMTLAKIDDMIKDKAKVKPAEPVTDYKKLYEDAQSKLDQIKQIIG